MDTSGLAQSIVSSLAPLFPFLAEISKGYLSKVGEDIWDETKSLWKLIAAKIGNKKKFKLLRSELIDHPDSSMAKDDLEKLINLALKEDRKFLRKAIRTMRKINRKPHQSISFDNSSVGGKVVQRSILKAEQKIKVKNSEVAGEIKQVLGIF